MKKDFLKKALVFGMIVLFIGMSITPLIGTKVVKKSTIPIFKGRTLYVGGIGPGNYTSIQAAINDAFDGDTIFVFNGTYFESLFVNKSITFIGEDRNTTVIDARKMGDVFFIVTDFVNISGFTIRKSGGVVPAGIKVRSSSYITITDNIIENNDEGIWIYDGASYNLIKNNILSNNGFGIQLYKAKNNNITDNIIQKGTFGVYLFINANENIVENNMIKNYASGIHIDDSSNHLISKNDISDCNYGICGKKSSNNLIGINNINNSNCGIWLQRFTKSVITQNHISSNNRAIYMKTTSSNNEISYNIIESNTWGIYLEYSSNNNQIIFNTFLHNFRNEFFMDCSNIWDQNYWGRSRVFPKFIIGGKIIPPGYGYLFPWFEFDRHPAQEPYNI